jgi:hypothetical protein
MRSVMAGWSRWKAGRAGRSRRSAMCGPAKIRSVTARPAPTAVPLQRADVVADRRLGDAEPLGRAGEVPVRGGGHEDLELS